MIKGEDMVEKEEYIKPKTMFEREEYQRLLNKINSLEEKLTNSQNALLNEKENHIKSLRKDIDNNALNLANMKVLILLGLVLASTNIGSFFVGQYLSEDQFDTVIRDAYQIALDSVKTEGDMRARAVAAEQYLEEEQLVKIDTAVEHVSTLKKEEEGLNGDL